MPTQDPAGIARIQMAKESKARRAAKADGEEPDRCFEQEGQTPARGDLHSPSALLICTADVVVGATRCVRLSRI